MQKKLFLC